MPARRTFLALFGVLCAFVVAVPSIVATSTHESHGSAITTHALTRKVPASRRGVPIVAAVVTAIAMFTAGARRCGGQIAAPITRRFEWRAVVSRGPPSSSLHGSLHSS